jgi:integrase/recombinase XerD
MGALKVILKKDKKKDGTYPLAIRITKDRASQYILIGHSILSTQWDKVNQRVKKSHPNSARLNNLILSKYAEANNKLLEMETEKKDVSTRTIKSGLKADKYATFFKQAAIYLANLRQHGKFNRISADSPRIERFREFLDGADITFSEISTTLIRRFMAYLKGTRSITDRTVINHLVVIRTIFNQAIAANIADRKHYPFGKGKIVIKFPDSLKIGLSPEEVKTLETLKLDPILNHARNLWLISFYFAGMRFSDVIKLKWTDIQNDRLFYAMGKNSKGGSLKIPSKAHLIFNQYKSIKSKHNLIFPDLEKLNDLDNLYEVQRYTNFKNKLANEALVLIAKEAEITKKMTMHIARHTFGNISGDKIPLQMLQKLYRHSSITTTIGYQSNFIHKDTDDALDAVLKLEA